MSFRARRLSRGARPARGGPAAADGHRRRRRRRYRTIQLRSGKLSQHEPRANGTARAIHADRLRAGREDQVRRAKAR